MEQVYLLFGEEDYLKNQYRDQLKEKLLPGGDAMNFSAFEGKGTSIREVIDLADTMPFFAERRLILMENTGFFKESATELAEYLEEMPETTAMIFVEKEVDKRGKLFKTVDRIGKVQEVSTPDEKTLLTWIASRVAKEGKKIRESTAKYFLSLCGTDMMTLHQEMEKLFSYTKMKTVIENADVEAICHRQINDEVFAMVDDMAAGRTDAALQRYYDLLSLREPPMKILALISRQFRILLTVSDMRSRGKQDAEIAKAAGIPAFAVRKYEANGRRFREKELREALENCVELENAVKIGNLNDQISVELLLVQYSK